MKKNKYISALSIISLFMLGSCSSDSSVDTEKPVIILNAPEEGARLAVGTDIHFDMEVSDNVALGSYNIDIHDDFDGHNHAAESAFMLKNSIQNIDESPDNDTRVPFVYNHTWTDISGKRNDHVHHHEIVIAKDAKRGKYHFVVKVLDKAGNQSMEFRTIYIVDPEDADHDHDHEHNH